MLVFAGRLWAGITRNVNTLTPSFCEALLGGETRFEGEAGQMDHNIAFFKNRCTRAKTYYSLLQI